ncbi:MAG: YhcH/YjgK/YiaL family protein [Bacteroidetes bacterium]|nr:YhcH/YjgK/YiaL family protein [Bacteroidota bacterium]
MVIDSIENAAKYFSIHPHFQKAFEYIQQPDLQHIGLGTYQVNEHIRAIFSHNMGMTAAESCSEFECHNKQIDIQLCIDGVEEFGWKPRASCTQPNGGYDDEKDVQLYFDRPDMFFKLTNGQFVILFPEDVHAPMIGTAAIRKLVIKVKI